MIPFFTSDFDDCTKPRKVEKRRSGCLAIFSGSYVDWQRWHEWDITKTEKSGEEFQWHVYGQCKHCGVREKHTSASESEMLESGIPIPKEDGDA